MPGNRATPIGAVGRVGDHGIFPGSPGEVVVERDGRADTYLARAVDGGVVRPGAEVVVLEYLPPRTVIVTPLHEERLPSSSP